MSKKILLSIMSLALFFQIFVPMVSEARTAQLPQDQENSVTIDGMGNEYTEEESMEILEAMSIMDGYISNKGDKLHLDPKAKKHVEGFVYEHYKRGVKEINKQVKASTLELDTANKSVNTLVELPAQDESFEDGSFSTYSFTNKYWWGVKWYLSKSEAAYWQNRFGDYAFGWGAIAAIAGVLGAPVASVAAVIMSVGNYYLHRELRDNTSSKGSVLTFKWAPPAAYATKR